MPCISRLTLQWYHILIILPAKCYDYTATKAVDIIYLLIIAQFFLERYTTTDPV